MKVIKKINNRLKTDGFPSAGTGHGNDAETGFTLLEVMIAVALLAIAFVAVLGSQAKSLSRVTEAEFNNRASILASGKLAELKSGRLPVIDTTGDFGTDFPGYSWRLEVRDIEAATAKIPAAIVNHIQRLELRVAWGETNFVYTLVSYVPLQE
jgi:general secretion pathway protein I